MGSRHDLAQHGPDLAQAEAKLCPQNAHDCRVPRPWIYPQAGWSVLGEQLAPQFGG
ncbi:hypothetical protein ACFVRD_30895 [Streptomyces sp. NPDC057908]|uniref:hypothetical protein n=1 Tax=unclassified Streptomyces TaxID=2593676 RepID=UPI002E0E7AAC|nr:hypothetical protein OG609_45410 [Streptomyces sp. NBC_01224]